MAGSVELKVYRASPASIAPAWIGAAGCCIVGLAMMSSGASVGVSGVVVGAVALAASLWLGAGLATNRLVVTSAGLVYRNNLRRKYISWGEVQSFGVAPGRSQMGWPVLAIYLVNGSRLPTNVGAFTRGYPARIAHELLTWRQQLAPATPTGGDSPEAEPSAPTDQ
jgi:hypothetical protein